MRLLFDNGVVVNAENDVGLIVLSVVVLGGHEMVVQRLLKNGADVNTGGEDRLPSAVRGSPRGK